MSTEDTGKWVISTCGLNCAKCDIFEAGHGNERIRDEIVEWFKKERNKIVEPEQVRCEGCRGSLNLHWSPDCQMMLCARKKGLQHCFKCEEFPCTILDDFASDGMPHHKRTVENMKRMREIGLQKWIAEQKRRGECVFCP